CHWYEGRGLRCRDQKQLDAVLAAVGRSRADVSIAVSYTVERGGAEIQVMRVEGVSGSALRDAVIAAMSADASRSKRQLNVQTARPAGARSSNSGIRRAACTGDLRVSAGYEGCAS